MILVQNDHVIEQLSADAADPALGRSVLPRASKRRPVPSENLIRPLSGRTTLVPMVQSPDLGERDDLSEILVYVVRTSQTIGSFFVERVLAPVCG